LYDTIKYCALHHRTFLFAIFNESGAKNLEWSKDRRLHELYGRAKALFDLVAPQEYGIDRDEKYVDSPLTCVSIDFRQRGNWSAHFSTTPEKRGRRSRSRAEQWQKLFDPLFHKGKSHTHTGQPRPSFRITHCQTTDPRVRLCCEVLFCSDHSLTLTLSFSRI
jgi:hypothetical protein